VRKRKDELDESNPYIRKEIKRKEANGHDASCLYIKKKNCKTSETGGGSLNHVEIDILLILW